MALYRLSDTILKKIADSIRAKTMTTEGIKPIDMASKIMSIEGGNESIPYGKGVGGLDYLKYKFGAYVEKYISQNGLYINGEACTRDELEFYLLNRDNCLCRGKIHKNGVYVVDGNDVPVPIRGIGTHQIDQYTNFHNLSSLECLKYYGINCIRMSAYLKDHTFTYSDSQQSKGWLTTPEPLRYEMDRIISNCVTLGMYVIVDWHVWSGGGERLSTDDAIDFFEYFAQKYQNVPNVLYEMNNEPFSDTLEEIIYHNETIRTVIKKYVQDPILITGTRSLTNGVVEMNDALVNAGMTDVFISQHSYASSGNPATKYIEWFSAEIPIFCTEWASASSSTHTQSGINISGFESLMDHFNTNAIPNCCWKLTDQTMTYSLFRNRGSINNDWYSNGGYIESDLSIWGKLYLEKCELFAFEGHVDRESINPSDPSEPTDPPDVTDEPLYGLYEGTIVRTYNNSQKDLYSISVTDNHIDYSGRYRMIAYINLSDLTENNHELTGITDDTSGINNKMPKYELKQGDVIRYEMTNISAGALEGDNNGLAVALGFRVADGNVTVSGSSSGNFNPSAITEKTITTTVTETASTGCLFMYIQRWGTVSLDLKIYVNNVRWF